MRKTEEKENKLAGYKVNKMMIGTVESPPAFA